MHDELELHRLFKILLIAMFDPAVWIRASFRRERKREREKERERERESLQAAAI